MKKTILTRLPILLALILFLFTEISAMDAIPQNPPIILGFRVESIQEAPPNLLNPNGWILTYRQRDGCTVENFGGVITMSRSTTGWPPCGVMQTLKDVGVGSKFIFSSTILENTEQSEVYTSYDGSIFKPGIGTRTDVITSKYKDLTIWLQTYTSDATKLPITTKWADIYLRRLE